MITGDGARQITDPGAAAFGFAQRRSWVFSAWWYPAVLGFAGATHSVISLFAREDPETGVVLLIIGAVLAALGWALTVQPRFTKSQPKPASDISRIEAGIRITPGIVWTVLIGADIIVLLLVFFTPNGTSPEAFPLLGLLIAFSVGLAAGLGYTRWLMVNSAEHYERWLQRGQRNLQ